MPSSDIYSYECQVCKDEYIGETGRSLGERISEHQKSVLKDDEKSAISQHQVRSGHRQRDEIRDKVTIIDKEPRDIHRKVKEAIAIRIKNPKLNRTDGWDLPHIYNPLLRTEGGHNTVSALGTVR